MEDSNQTQTSLSPDPSSGPVVGAQPDVQQTQFNTPPRQPNKSKKKIIYTVLILLIVAALAAGAYWKFVKKDTTQNSKSSQTKASQTPITYLPAAQADQLFSNTMADRLSTDYVTEQIQTQTKLTKETKITTFDTRDTLYPRAFSIVKQMATDPNQKSELQTISVPEGLYASYKSLGNLPAGTIGLGNWFPIETSADGTDSDGVSLLPPTYSIQNLTLINYSFLPIGDFSMGERANLDQSLQATPIMTYNPQKVQQQKDSDGTYAVYDVTLSADAYNTFIQNVLTTTGQKTDSKFQTTLQADKATSLELWVDTSTKHLRKILYTNSAGNRVNVYYYDFAKASTINVPMPLAPAGELTDTLQQPAAKLQLSY